MIKAREAIQKMESYEYPTPFRKVISRYNIPINKIIKVNFNESPFPPSQKVKEALIKFIENGSLEWYPDESYDELRDAIAKLNDIEKERVIVGNGTDELLKEIIFTFVDRVDEVIIPIPNFSMYKIYAESIDANIIEVKYNENLTLDVIKLLESINEETRMILISNPNSPIGNTITKKDIIKILEKAKNAIVVIDEAYYEFYGKTIVDQIKKYQNLIVLRTFSKAYGLASLRIGYAVASEEIIQELNKAKNPFNVNKLGEIAAIAALKDQNYMKKVVNEVKRTREYLTKELRKLGLRVCPSKTNFILARFSKNTDLICKKLEKKGIFLRDTSKIFKLENCLRIAIPLIKDVPRLVNGIEEVLR